MEMIDEAEVAAISVQLARLNDEMKLGAQLGRQFTGTLLGAFDGLAIKGRGLNDVLKGVTLSLSRMVVQAAFKPLERGIGQALASALSGGVGYAKGAAFQGGVPVPFAKGGVIASPTTFPLANGSTGLMGEAGAEAILPLTRGRDGRLGVAASGGGGTHVIVNIAASDVESFRRSEAQVAATLARAVSLGQRNL
jgi:phage-related minor tail protein